MELAVSGKPETRLSRGYLICLVGTAIWSTTAIFIRYLTKNYQLPPLVLAFWRDLFVFLVLGLILLLVRRNQLKITRDKLLFFSVYGVVLALFNSLWTFSVSFNGAAVATVLAYSSAGITAILGWIIYKEELDKLKVLVVVLSIMGCVFVSGAHQISSWNLNILGIVTGICSGFGFAFYSLFGKEASRRNIYPWTSLVYTFGFAALYLFILNRFLALFPAQAGTANLFWLGGQYSGWIILFILAVIPTIGGYGLYTVSLTILPASIANLIATLEPAITAFLAYLLLKEELTLTQLIGGAFIIGGVILLRFRENGRIKSSLIRIL
jgi:drug/metabolite transporter (DMT)-like permease